MTRLASISKALDGRLRAVSPERRTAAVQHACNVAAESQPNLDVAMERARAFLVNEGQVPPNLASELSTLVDKYDEEYFNLQELAEEGKAGVDDWRRPFSLARLASALSFGVTPTEFDTAAEAIYEALTVFDDPSTLIAELERITA